MEKSRTNFEFGEFGAARQLIRLPNMHSEASVLIEETHEDCDVAVVEDLNVLADDFGLGRPLACKARVVNKVLLQRPKEALGVGMIPTVALARSPAASLGAPSPADSGLQHPNHACVEPSVARQAQPNSSLFDFLSRHPRAISARKWTSQKAGRLTGFALSTLPKSSKRIKRLRSFSAR